MLFWILVFVVVLLVLLDWSFMIQDFNISFLHTVFTVAVLSFLIVRGWSLLIEIRSLSHLWRLDNLLTRNHNIILTFNGVILSTNSPLTCPRSTSAGLLCSLSLVSLHMNDLLFYVVLRIIWLIVTVDFIAVNHSIVSLSLQELLVIGVTILVGLRCTTLSVFKSTLILWIAISSPYGLKIKLLFLIFNIIVNNRATVSKIMLKVVPVRTATNLCILGCTFSSRLNPIGCWPTDSAFSIVVSRSAWTLSLLSGGSPVIFHHDFFLNQINVFLTCTQPLDQCMVFLLQVPILFLKFIIIKGDRNQFLLSKSLSFLCISTVNLILFYPLFKLLSPRLIDSVVLMNLIRFFNVSLTFHLKLFDQLLNFVFTFFNSLLESQLGLIALGCFGLESLHFSAKLDLAVFDVQSERLDISLVLLLKKIMLLGQMINTFLHLNFHLIFFNNLTILKIDISLVLLVLPYR